MRNNDHPRLIEVPKSVSLFERCFGKKQKKEPINLDDCFLDQLREIDEAKQKRKTDTINPLIQPTIHKVYQCILISAKNNKSVSLLHFPKDFALCENLSYIEYVMETVIQRLRELDIKAFPTCGECPYSYTDTTNKYCGHYKDRCLYVVTPKTPIGVIKK